MDKIEIVIVTGMSGAGKTTAMAAFENMAYCCIDNYPIALLGAFSEFLKDNTNYQRIAMAVSLADAPKAIRFLNNVDWLNVSVIFLDCDDNIILKRYKETRRTHPILISNKVSTLVEAIEYERKLARPISKEANVVIDTTNLKGNKFQQLLENQFNHQSINPFRISFVSFGYKHGIPKDADLLFDVRFLPNPFYIEELRNLTGNDKEVYDYVGRETTILTIIGILLGLIAGYFLEMFILKTCELDILMFDTRISIWSYVYSASLTILFTLIVSVVTYFALKKIDMIESLKSVE